MPEKQTVQLIQIPVDFGAIVMSNNMVLVDQKSGIRFVSEAAANVLVKKQLETKQEESEELTKQEEVQDPVKRPIKRGVKQDG